MIVKIIENGWINNSQSLDYYGIDKLVKTEIDHDVKESEYSHTIINLYRAKNEIHDTPNGPYLEFMPVDFIHLKNTQLVFVMNDDGKTIDTIRPLKNSDGHRTIIEQN